jgi:integrase
MSQQAAVARKAPKDAPPIPHGDFLGGAPLVFTAFKETVRFTFADDEWYLGDRRKRNQKLSRVRIPFVVVPEWLRPGAKGFLAHMWLAERKSLNACLRALDALKLMGAALGEHFGEPVEALNRFHAQAVADDFARQARTAIPILEKLGPVGKRAKYKALGEAGVRAPLTLHLAAGQINQFGRWLRRREAMKRHDFVVKLTREITWTQTRVGGKDAEKLFTDDVLTACLKACDADYEDYLARREEVEAIPRIDPATGRGNMRYVHARASLQWAQNRAVMAMALKLQFLAARRAGATVLLPVEPKLEKTGVELEDGTTQPVVHIWFRAYKMHGELGAPEPIPFPGYFGEVALDAVEKAKALHGEMASAAPAESRDLLFLQWTKEKQENKARSKAMTRPLTESRLQMYFNSNSQTIPGLVQRYGIEGGEHLSLHDTRGTMATELVSQGGSLVLAARYLGHITSEGDNSLMAKLFYLAGGTPEQRERMKQSIERGTASGIVFNAFARAATALVGGETEAAPVPPNELTYEQAILRIRQRAVEVIEDEFTRDAVIALLEQGLVIQFTSYGGCILPAKTGPCPTAEKCPIGTEPESPETLAGKGCPYQVLMPHARDHLVQEIAMMGAKIEWYEAHLEYAFWLAREKRQVEIWQKQVEAIDAMERAVASVAAGGEP